MCVLCVCVSVAQLGLQQKIAFCSSELHERIDKRESMVKMVRVSALHRAETHNHAPCARVLRTEISIRIR